MRMEWAPSGTEVGKWLFTNVHHREMVCFSVLNQMHV